MLFWNKILKIVKKMNVDASGILDFEVFPLRENLMSEGRGACKKGVLVACAGAPTAEAEDLLAKMLQAAKFDLAADAFVVWLEGPQPFSFSSLRNGLGISSALFFGIPPKQAGLNLNAQAYQPLKVAGVDLLFAASLADIIADPKLKRPLWEGMKTMFNC